MDHRFSSIAAFSATLAAAALGAAVMTGSAHAQGGGIRDAGEVAPFVGSRSRADVQAELMQNRALVTSFASEWTPHVSQPMPSASGTTRAQARADYIAARDEVRAMNSEGGGAGYFARSTVRTPATLMARQVAQ